MKFRIVEDLTREELGEKIKNHGWVLRWEIYNFSKNWAFSEIISYELDEDGAMIHREKELKRIPLSHCAFEGALGQDDNF